VLVAAMLVTTVVSGSVTASPGLWPHVYGATITGASPAPLNATWRVAIRRASYAIVPNGSNVVSGSATISGNRITFHDVAGPFACPGGQATGTYAWRLQGRKLTFTRVSDTCPGRRIVLAHAFTRIS
jgi:hypothetical protein